ncbi:hypothetical protein ACFL1X_10015 [Candidatus Hydrogenedentota bacterium]
MGTKTKVFDCVEMKRRIQSDLRKEYESRKTEFSSYADFINCAARDSDEIRAFREKMSAARLSNGK